MQHESIRNEIVCLRMQCVGYKNENRMLKMRHAGNCELHVEQSAAVAFASAAVI